MATLAAGSSSEDIPSPLLSLLFWPGKRRRRAGTAPSQWEPTRSPRRLGLAQGRETEQPGVGCRNDTQKNLPLRSPTLSASTGEALRDVSTCSACLLLPEGLRRHTRK